MTTHITKTWFDGEKVVTQEIPESEVYKQEPFGYFQYAMHLDAWVQNRDENKGVAFYTTPPAAQRTWVGLTDADKREFAAAQHGWEDLLAAAEAKLKEKNT